MKRGNLFGLLFMTLMLSTLPVSIIYLLDADTIANISMPATSEDEPQENETFEVTLYLDNESDGKSSMRLILSKIACSNAFDYSDVFHDIIIPPPDFS